ncbi:type VI secretion system baseplate subunit TssG [Pantoea sp. BIGb0393]|uniref:Type VI secretion system baseplate subunit TssG n=1 Tax=Pantoea nemavictus TaxID=2726955 RepID=A0ABU8PWJ1_9GAMM|nr:type VI secretion system baseplate subunit TssG [Pantoea nemavictus]
MTDDNKQNRSPLPPFWLDANGDDQTARFNFYRFCQLLEQATHSRLGTGRTPECDPVRFRPNPRLGFPAGELKRTEIDADNPDAPPTVRTHFLGLYGVDSPLPTTIIDDINQARDGADAMAAFLDIFNHRLMTQFYRIWRKYSYPTTFAPGGTDAISKSLMALTGIAHSHELPSSRLLAILQPLLHTTHTAEGIAAVINSQAPNTHVEVFAHHAVRMPVAKRAQLSLRGGLSLDQNPVLGDEICVAGYCSRVELLTDDLDEVKGWMPNGQLRQDVMTLLRTYLGCDYDLRFWLTMPTKLLPLPRLGADGLFNGYNMMLGLREDNLHEMPEIVRIMIGRLREENGVIG